MVIANLQYGRSIPVRGGFADFAPPVPAVRVRE
jgi:hypothetical protein